MNLKPGVVTSSATLELEESPMARARRAAAAAGMALALAMGLLTAIAPPASAMLGPVPPASAPYCGERSKNINYAACVVVVNRTRGFNGPGTLTPLNGLVFETSNVKSSRDGDWALGATGSRRSLMEVDGGWSAYDCSRSWPTLQGCTVTTTVSYLDPDRAGATIAARNVALQRAVRADGATSLILSGGVRYRADPVSECAAVSSKYVRCRDAGNQGPRDYTRFNYEIVNEVVRIRITNRLPSKLTLKGTPSWINAIEDVRGDSHSRLIPDFRHGQASSGWWGGLLAIDRNSSNITITYQATDARGHDDAYNGSRITVQLGFRDGALQLANACEAVPARAGAARPRCDVEGSSAGGITSLLITLLQ